MKEYFKSSQDGAWRQGQFSISLEVYKIDQFTKFTLALGCKFNSILVNWILKNINEINNILKFSQNNLSGDKGENTGYL